MAKIGLVVEGGGMKCAYSAAVLDKFLDDNISFYYVVGVSAGSANAASYLAGQRGRNLRFYTDHIKEKGYFGFGSFLKTGDLFGLDYIYSTLTNEGGGDPLDWKAIERNPAKYEIGATDAITGEPHYFDKSEVTANDYQMIKASCALPAACRPRFVGGVPYYDGGVGMSIPVDRAFEQGCDKVVVISSKTRDFVKKPEGFKRFYSIRCRKYPKIVEELNNRHTRYMENFRHVFELEKEGKAFVFALSRSIETGTYTMDAGINRQVYDLGLSDYEAAREKLKAFMK